MLKITDRLLLGAVAGIIGNQAKTIVSRYAKQAEWAEIDGMERAAGMLVPAHKVSTPLGQVVGYAADNVIAGMLGVVAAYALSITGANRAVMKGAFTGQAAWTALYGVASTMGATTVKVVSPKTVLSELTAHTVYGLVTAWVLILLGDQRLFNGGIPISASSAKVARQSIVERARAMF